MVGYRGGLMLEIRKIWGDTYLVNGEHLTQDFNEAVVIAYENKEKIKNFKVEYAETTFWKKIKNKLNFPFLLLESWM